MVADERKQELIGPEKFLAARMLELADGQSKDIVLNALCWAAASTIHHSYAKEDRQGGLEVFVNRIPLLMEAYEAGERRKPS